MAAIFIVASFKQGKMGAVIGTIAAVGFGAWMVYNPGGVQAFGTTVGNALSYAFSNWT